MNDSHLFKIAREESFKSDYTSNCSSARIGCVVTYKGAILAKSHNTNKTHPSQKKYNKWRYDDSQEGRYLPEKCHAECRCLSKIRFLDIDFSKVIVYTYRETRNGHLAPSRPCAACAACMREMGISTVKYTTERGYATEEMI